jgi:hypothetical protein
MRTANYGDTGRAVKEAFDKYVKERAEHTSITSIGTLCLQLA